MNLRQYKFKKGYYREIVEKVLTLPHAMWVENNAVLHGLHDGCKNYWTVVPADENYLDCEELSCEVSEFGDYYILTLTDVQPLTDEFQIVPGSVLLEQYPNLKTMVVVDYDLDGKPLAAYKPLFDQVDQYTDISCMPCLHIRHRDAQLTEALPALIMMYDFNATGIRGYRDVRVTILYDDLANELWDKMILVVTQMFRNGSMNLPTMNFSIDLQEAMPAIREELELYRKSLGVFF